MRSWPTARLSFSRVRSMDYKPVLPSHNDNVSHDRPVREFLLLFSGITAALLIAFWLLGLGVDLAVTYISPEMEAKIFSAGPVPAGENNACQAELQRMTDRLRSCIHIAYPLKLILMDSDTANAMALPGGRIVVFTGLLDTVSSENGLSFILAHELAHFKHRDHLRGMGRGIVMTALSALLTGAGSDITRLLAPSAQFGMAQYSQDREAMADKEALTVLNCAYGHVGGADEFFRAVQPKADSSIRRITGHYFDSHPEAEKRIQTLQRQARQMHFESKSVLPLPNIFTKKSCKND